jgi:hypothetical protein
MTVTSSVIAKRLEDGLAGLIGKDYNNFASQYKNVFETRKSNKSKEEMVMTVGLGLAPVKPEGGLIYLDNMSDGYTARAQHVNVAMGFAITREAIDDNLYESQAEMRTKALARSLAETKEMRAAVILNSGFSGYTIGDGVSLLNSAHPLAGGGTVSNTAGAADMTETTLKAAVTNIRTNFVDDRGVKIRVTPRKLVVPPALQFDAFEILRSDLTTLTAANGGNGITNQNKVNSLRAGGFFPEGSFAYDYLTDINAWFVLTDVANGLIHWERKGLEFGMEHVDPYTGNIICTAQERYSFMVGDWRRVYGGSGT